MQKGAANLWKSGINYNRQLKGTLFNNCLQKQNIVYKLNTIVFKLNTNHMLKNLFSSETRIILLNQFLMNPDQEFYLRQISNKFKLSPRLVSLELKNLHIIDLIVKRVSGNQHHYQINKQHPLFVDLRNIFLKTIGLKAVVKNYLEQMKSEIEFAFIYGSMADGSAKADSDIDLMIIGSSAGRKFSGLMIKAGNELGREINFNIFSLDEFTNRIRSKDHFISSVMNSPKIFIIKDSNELNRLAEK